MPVELMDVDIDHKYLLPLQKETAEHYVPLYESVQTTNEVILTKILNLNVIKPLDLMPIYRKHCIPREQTTTGR